MNMMNLPNLVDDKGINYVGDEVIFESKMNGFKETDRPKFMSKYKSIETYFLNRMPNRGRPHERRPSLVFVHLHHTWLD